MAAELLLTIEVTAVNPKTIVVGLDTTGLSNTQKETAFADYLDTHHNGLIATLVDPKDMDDAEGKIGGFWGRVLSLITFHEEVRDGRTYRIYTITQP